MFRPPPETWDLRFPLDKVYNERPAVRHMEKLVSNAPFQLPFSDLKRLLKLNGVIVQGWVPLEASLDEHEPWNLTEMTMVGPLTSDKAALQNVKNFFQGQKWKVGEWEQLSNVFGRITFSRPGKAVVILYLKSKFDPNKPVGTLATLQVCYDGQRVYSLYPPQRCVKRVPHTPICTVDDFIHTLRNLGKLRALGYQVTWCNYIKPAIDVMHQRKESVYGEQSTKEQDEFVSRSLTHYQSACAPYCTLSLITTSQRDGLESVVPITAKNVHVDFSKVKEYKLRITDETIKVRYVTLYRDPEIYRPAGQEWVEPLSLTIPRAMKRISEKLLKQSTASYSRLLNSNPDNVLLLFPTTSSGKIDAVVYTRSMLKSLLKNANAVYFPCKALKHVRLTTKKNTVPNAARFVKIQVSSDLPYFFVPERDIVKASTSFVTDVFQFTDVECNLTGVTSWQSLATGNNAEVNCKAGKEHKIYRLDEVVVA